MGRLLVRAVRTMGYASRPFRVALELECIYRFEILEQRYPGPRVHQEIDVTLGHEAAMVTTLRTDLVCPFKLVSDIDVTAFLALVPRILWDL